ncbi:DUF2934 domain-containing protein [Methylobacillus arboreus]|uniref:DUF2934 domain-containing protein n=1 Tax=Methylobacillus arboreus TaxID=755170 RepID=UPI001E549C15|nr:DUF2934 domain-containing protein [Methylobacillus arboreus]MCB5189534.1 DUF2934 domain-containing protein [Methylobacillus arboreus]
MATTKSTTSKKPATPKAVIAKPAAEKKTTTRKASTSKAKTTDKVSQISPEERYRMVEVAAYFLAERNSFAGNPVEYWTAAEAQISKLLS